MAGPGMAPKDPSRRARRNADPHPTTRLEFKACAPPELPESFDWHPMTLSWWKTWQESPMAALMGPTDWSFMLDTALMHHSMWAKGQWTLAAEVRLRVAKYGATPEDRLRLRIQWADADDKDSKVPQMGPVPDRSSKRYGQLKVMPLPKDDPDNSDGAS